MIFSRTRLVAILIAMALFQGACQTSVPQPPAGLLVSQTNWESSMVIQYLEVVTPDVNATCAALEKLHDVTFRAPVPGLGNARTAELRSGGRIGVRAPLRPDEEPVVRPYFLCEEIESVVKVARDAGAKLALPPTPIPGHGTFAIYVLGGIQYGLWQL